MFDWLRKKAFKSYEIKHITQLPKDLKTQQLLKEYAELDPEKKDYLEQKERLTLLIGKHFGTMRVD